MIVYVSYKLDAKEIGNGREGRGKAKIIRTDFFPPARGRIISSLPPLRSKLSSYTEKS